MLPLNDLRNNKFSWGKMQQKTFEDIKKELYANLLAQSYSLQKKQKLLLSPLKKPLAVFFRKKDIRSRKLIPTEQNYLNIERELLKIVFVVTKLSNSFLEDNLPYRRAKNQ